MSEALWREIADRIDTHAYMDRVDRSAERISATAEHFTPTPLVIEVIKRIPTCDLAPGKTVLDPACGDGQFLVAVKWFKVLAHGMAPAEALEDLYGIDLMRDNVDLCLARLGGGTILVGDALCPERRVVGQREDEYGQVRSLLAHEPAEATLF
jgi:hypothetical protein